MDTIINKDEIPNVTNIKLMQQYINALIVNINRNQLPSTINVIFDSGAVNGILGIGAAIYIHHLEKKNYLKVKNVSGCSIGSLIALWFIYDCPEEMYVYLDILFNYYKKHKNFYIYETIVKDIIIKLIPDENDMTKINDRLYINYYDTKKSKNRVISHFKNRTHLLTCILRSSQVPFITNNTYKYQERYIDGIVPYIFNEETGCKNLFIQLIHLTNPLNCLYVKNEQNIYPRLLRGITGVNDFFVNGQTYLCSYVNETSYLTNLNMFIRKQFVLIIICIIEHMYILKKHMPSCIKNACLYKKIVLLSKSYWDSLQNKLV